MKSHLQLHRLVIIVISRKKSLLCLAWHWSHRIQSP